MRHCPCGRVEIETLLGRPRKLCTDPIPLCGVNTCDKYLPCGKHQCKMNCHNGECNTCEVLVEQKCLCGKEKRYIPCFKLNYPDYLKKQLLT